MHYTDLIASQRSSGNANDADMAVAYAALDDFDLDKLMGFQSCAQQLERLSVETGQPVPVLAAALLNRHEARAEAYGCPSETWDVFGLLPGYDPEATALHDPGDTGCHVVLGTALLSDYHEHGGPGGWEYVAADHTSMLPDDED